jgi:hypothetical protein
MNKYKPHVYVLPEDDANRQLANGFLLCLEGSNIQVLEEVGGWIAVLECFVTDHVAGMMSYASRFMILLIDFDRHPERLHFARGKVPEQLAERVFVLGALSEPEELRAALSLPYESIGASLAKDCWERTDTVWRHELLSHNAAELERLNASVRPILFPTSPLSPRARTPHDL